MRVAKKFKKYCPTCNKMQLAEYGHDEKDVVVGCSVCHTELSRQDKVLVYERLMRLAISPIED